jgi:hypothetical protein
MKYYYILIAYVWFGIKELLLISAPLLVLFYFTDILVFIPDTWSLYFNFICILFGYYYYSKNKNNKIFNTDISVFVEDNFMTENGRAKIDLKSANNINKNFKIFIIILISFLIYIILFSFINYILELNDITSIKKSIVFFIKAKMEFVFYLTGVLISMLGKKSLKARD